MEKSFEDTYFIKHPVFYDENDKFGIKEKAKEKAQIIRFSDVDELMKVIQFIAEIYRGVFEMMPKALKNEDKSTVEQALAILRYYIKIKQFASTVINKRDELVD